LEGVRQKEYGRLDATGHTYLDYTGGGLYSDSQILEHLNLLRGDVFGNPHSGNPASVTTTRLVDSARDYILEYFNASPDEYVAIFTANATAAIKLVGEAYPFQSGDRYLLTFDNHNSINGIREFAHMKGASVTYVPVVPPELLVAPNRLADDLGTTRPGQHNLFAYPVQSNFSGVQHPLEWIDQAHEQGWDVLLNSAAFVPTNRLDLSKWHPDFVPLSFYKMFGYPTGVGCLIARKTALAKLSRPWFAGGTILFASVQAEDHILAEGEAAFEEGSINYLNLPAVEMGLRHISGIGIDKIHERVVCLTDWLLEDLVSIRHSNGSPLVRIYSPTNMTHRGGTIAINFHDPNGNLIDHRRIEAIASDEHISLRTGCFCNPGAGEIAHGLTKEDMAIAFQDDGHMTFDEFLSVLEQQDGKSAGAVRVSLGMVTNFADGFRFSEFVRSLLDRKSEGI